MSSKEDSRILSGENNPAFGKTYNTKEKNPEWAAKIQASTKGKINLGDKNGMKHLYARDKLSATRKKMLKDQKLRDKMSLNCKQAWIDGAYEGVRVGQCKWYEYIKSNGDSIKVQGKWELAFAKWADEQKLIYTTHVGRIPYELNGQQKSYYPDFYVEDWKCWVDIKNNYHYSLQKDKFDALSNAGVKIKILFKQDLLDLGINLKMENNVQ